MIPIPEEGFTTNDENSEFTDGFFVSWTYPITLFLNAELKRYLGDLSDPNLVGAKFEVAGILSKYGEIFPSKMKINPVKKHNAEAKITFEFGVASLDVMEKKISELDLGTIETGNLYNYIDVNIHGTYPDTPVFFPRIRTPENYLETVSTLYGGFNVFNETSRTTGLIYRNEFTSTGQAIFNFIKPIVYLLHILIKGFESAGYKLTGDILNDTDLMYIGFNHNTTADIELIQDVKRIPYSWIELGYGTATQTFDLIGGYIFSLILDNDETYITMRVTNLTSGVVLYEAYKQGYDYNHPNSKEYNYTLPVFLTTTKIKVDLIFSSSAHPPMSTFVFVAFLNPAGGSERKAFYLPESLVLNKYVPDVKFIEIVKAVKMLKNYTLSPGNNIITMNRIKNSLPEEVKDFTFSEQDDVYISVNSLKGYIFKFAAPEEFEFMQYQYGSEGLVKMQKEIKAEDGFEDRELLAYPMPLTNNFYEQAADQVKDDVEGLPMVGYDGDGFRNHPLDLSQLSIPNIYQVSYKNWLIGRVTASPFKWACSTKNPLALSLKSEDCIYAYGAYHKIRSIYKKHHADNITEIEVTTDNRY